MSEPAIRPEVSPAVWRGADLTGDDGWIRRPSESCLEALSSALHHALGTGRELAELVRDDFPLGDAQSEVDSWLRELDSGRGFLLVRGLPIDGLSEREIEILYWGLGLHLGTPVSQNTAGDLLGHVRDTGANPDDPSVRRYRTSRDLTFHSDGADIIGLLCLQTAQSGGQSLVVSAPAVFNEVMARRPDLAPVLFEHFPFDRNEEHNEGEAPFFMFPICRYEQGALSTFYIGWYIRDSQRHPDAPRLSTQQSEVLDLIDSIAADPQLHLSMDLERGDLQLAKNSVLLHARTAFVDHEEPERKRHMLRLWLAATRGFDDGDALLRMGIPTKDGAIPD